MIASTRRLPGVVAALIAALWLTGCPAPQDQSVFVNLRDEPVTLIYRGLSYAQTGSAYCQIRRPWVGSARDADDLDPREWNRAPQHGFDEVNCEVTITVPPRTAVWIGDRDSCGAVRSGAVAPAWPAIFQLLRVETTNGVVEFSKWEAARAFVHVRHFFGNDECRFDFR
jgi:hypothetical protein